MLSSSQASALILKKLSLSASRRSRAKAMVVVSAMMPAAAGSNLKYFMAQSLSTVSLAV
jgi:hypothetical protein